MFVCFIPGLVMARLPEKEQAELAAMIGRAVDYARCLHRLTWDEMAGRMDLDHAQLGRMRTGKEAWSLLRLVKLGPDVFGDFSAALLDEVGGWEQVLSRGLVTLFEPFLASRGLARMARANTSYSAQRERVSA